MRRFDTLMIIVSIIGIVFIYRLFDLQIVNGADYRAQSEKRLVREIISIAPRGNVYDRYGKLMVTSDIGSNVQLYPTDIDKKTLNENLLKLTNILEKNGDTYYNNFPVDFETMTFKKSDDNAIQWKKNLKLPENATPMDIISYFKEKYEIENDDLNDVKKIIALRYEIATKGYSRKLPLTIAKNISLESMLQITEHGDLLNGVNIVTTPIRKYLTKNTASHLIGYVGLISSKELETRKDKGYTQNDYIGKTGVEATFEEFLRGENGRKRIEMNSNGIITGSEEIVDSSMGDSVVLTIDMDLQAKAEEVLEKYVTRVRTGGYSEKFPDANAGSIVVMDVKTSEVLALASYPNYSPEDFIDGISNSEYDRYFKDPSKPMYNRAISGAYSPGSTFKPLTAIAGIESGAITVEEKVLDKGVYDKGHKPVCWIWTSNRGNHGYVNVSDALKVSCNYYFYDIGYRMGIDNLSKYARLFGLGRKTGIELIGESSGTLASKEYINALSEKDGKKRTWMIADTLSASIGQSYNSFTPIQMAYYIATLANGGVKNEVTLLKDVVTSDGQIVPREEVQKIVNPKINKEPQEYGDLDIDSKTIKAVFEGMRSVTGERGGTAYSTFSSFPIEVAGKTGTATASSGSANAWFVGFAPYDDPEIAVVCVIEHGGHGSYTAPPVKEVMEEYFGYNNKVTERLNIESLDQILIQ